MRTRLGLLLSSGALLTLALLAPTAPAGASGSGGAGPTTAALRGVRARPAGHFSAASVPTPTESTVTLVNGIQSGNVDLYLNSTKAASALSPTGPISLILPAATYAVKVFQAGANPNTATPILTTSLTVPAGKNLSVMVQAPATLLSFVNDNSGTPAGKARLSFRNTSARGPVDVLIDGSQVVSGLAGPNSVDVVVPGGAHTLTVKVAGAATLLIGSPLELTVIAGEHDEIYLLGQAASPSDALDIVSSLPSGYRLVATDGGVFSFGSSAFFGSMGGIPLAAPVVGNAATPDNLGYWLVAQDGGVFTFGDATFHGSLGGLPLAAPVVGIAPTADGEGYWMVATDGGVFTFGDARFHGSLGGTHLDAPIVGIAPTPDGGGYWLVATDGGVFAFGDAAFWGSLGGHALAAPVVGVAATADGGGYWLAETNGTVSAFGDAQDFGSVPTPPTKPVISIDATPDGLGYLLAAGDGGVFAFGNASFYGSTGGLPLTSPVINLAG